MELELNQAKLSLQTTTMPRVSQQALLEIPWVDKIQQGAFNSAERYIGAATELADDSTVLRQDLNRPPIAQAENQG